MELEKQNLRKTLLFVEEDFDTFKKGQIIHHWGKTWVIIAASPTEKQKVPHVFFHTIEQNIDKLRKLSFRETNKILPHLNYRGKRMAKEEQHITTD